jgi:hypothetical protein
MATNPIAGKENSILCSQLGRTSTVSTQKLTRTDTHIKEGCSAMHSPTRRLKAWKSIFSIKYAYSARRLALVHNHWIWLAGAIT